MASVNQSAVNSYGISPQPQNVVNGNLAVVGNHGKLYMSSSQVANQNLRQINEKAGANNQCLKIREDR